MPRPSRSCMNKVRTPAGGGATSMKRCTQITTGIAPRSADQSDISSRSSPRATTVSTCAHTGLSVAKTRTGHIFGLLDSQVGTWKDNVGYLPCIETRVGQD